MRKSMLFFLIVTGFGCYGQKPKLNDVVFDSKITFEIPNEGKIINTLFDEPDTKEEIRSSLCVNDDTLRSISFTESEMKGDTLKILIYQTDPAYHHQYLISIVNKKYFISYYFLTSGEYMKRETSPIETKLVLNNLDFRKGQEIRGYTEFTGKCLKGCWEGFIRIKGNFKVTIK